HATRFTLHGASMAHYEVYMEVGPEGVWVSHVPALPGCVVGTYRQDAALLILPEAIRAYHAWLRRHGEAAPDPDPITLTVAEVQEGSAPVRVRSRPALFAPDREPLTRRELAELLRRAGYSRADLLALVRGLAKAILDWRADAEAMTIRELLRHTGNAEEWYVSRLVDPATLPAEWETDDRLPIYRFLTMERRTVAARLRRLTDAELGTVFTPTF